MIEFRTLNADEIECRVSTVSEKGCSLLLYKDSRADMILLDETVGPANWQRAHTRDNANCIVSIWDVSKMMWISKEDTGTESFTEKEKGLASDSFKRACFNWGIGRELYTAPFIWVQKNDVALIESESQGKKKYTTYDRFKVDSITYENKKIVGIVISNAKTNNVVYTFNTKAAVTNDKSSSKEIEQNNIANQKIGDIKLDLIKNELKRTGTSEAQICARKSYGIKSLNDITEELFIKIMTALKATKTKES